MKMERRLFHNGPLCDAWKTLRKRSRNIRYSLVLKIILSVGIVLLLSICAWAFFNVRHYQTKMMADIVSDCDQLSEAIRLGTHYAMMFNAREDINQIIHNMGKLKGIEHIRIYNKSGQIKFSNIPPEVGSATDIQKEACIICHHTSPPLQMITLDERKRFFPSVRGNRVLGLISPIYNEPGCDTAACHAHPKGKKVLGALDVVISLEKTDMALNTYKNWLFILAVFVFFATSAILLLIMTRFFIAPIKKLIQGTRKIGNGEYTALEPLRRRDEIGRLAEAIHRMGLDIGRKQRELNRQKNEYERLFELVPCIITVQDRDYKLIGYNQEFSNRFGPRPGDYCYSAYKGRTEKCEFCPVEKTFQDGNPHYSEETGLNKDGSLTHWIVKTAPMKNNRGEIIGAMEVNLDITHKKQLEDKLRQSEQKYYAIFNNIPNSIFVLDADSLEIIDCNDSIKTAYGYRKNEIVGQSFLLFFLEEERERYHAVIRTSKEINQVRQVDHKGEIRFVNIRISPSEFSGRKALLVTTSDITERLEVEMQLIQAGKMATLGEMATGVAHELNQPLSVIKTASSYFMKKVRKNEPIPADILLTMATEIDGHVDRASNIINHLRQFGRKSDLRLEKVQVNDVLKSAFEIFSQQLKLREINVRWVLTENLPLVQAEAGRLEQVFVNLLINARDAIDEKWKTRSASEAETKQIELHTATHENFVVITISDTGIGIPKQIIGKIFEPFFTTKKVGEGTGIGLSISYGIIQDFKGTILVSSGSDGTRFTIRLPRSEEP